MELNECVNRCIRISPFVVGNHPRRPCIFLQGVVHCVCMEPPGNRAKERKGRALQKLSQEGSSSYDASSGSSSEGGADMHVCRGSVPLR